MRKVYQNLVELLAAGQSVVVATILQDAGSAPRSAGAKICGTAAVYIGMIGSRKKRDHLFNVLTAKGVSSATLQRVHSPIGLDILAETPEEIAASIVAELIKARAEREKCAAQE